MTIKGRWRIVEMEVWDQEAIDLLGPRGRGWATLTADGSLEGRIFFHVGDDSSFRAER